MAKNDEIRVLQGDEGKRYRMTLDLSSVLHRGLIELSNEHGVSKADASRDGIKLLIEFNRLRKEGYEIIGTKQSGDTREIVRIVIGF